MFQKYKKSKLVQKNVQKLKRNEKLLNRKFQKMIILVLLKNGESNRTKMNLERRQDVSKPERIEWKQQR